MNDIDPITGLPKELGIWEELVKEEQRIKIKTVKRKFGKLITLIEGLNKKDVNIKEIAKKLKSKLACGGTAKDEVIELQGDHAKKAKEELIKMGFAESTIQLER
ncbi:translation initiation factor [Candidatus Woesearchaeota archaeon]|nr:translation initiation factor [Candidatus Woesearchaeota archaeon]